MLNKIDVESGEPIARRVYRVLRQAIVTMQFRPGQALSEQEIADQLGVSRQPVREAFIKLSEAGLLTIRPQRGSFVVKISVKQVLDARFVREAVETAVVRKACETITAAGIAELRDNLKAQWDIADEPVPVRFLELDEAFHRAIAIGAECDYAWRIVEETKAQMDRVRYLSVPYATPIRRLISQHQAVLEAIVARDPVKAEAAMGLHLREILTSLPELEGKFPDLFTLEDASAPPTQKVPSRSSGRSRVAALR
ncbi:DNA-binding GntR family transcriptional regulator [Azospirillum lipoferum]|uniref:GntR family transcriptional regulator n=1 Tax=Azospirillum lipoferum TaxID=193 RepID=A0A5A9GQX9_AZOLI|nr:MULTISPECIES: GntR family transcriptional regulator [Azospirillum]KAA0595709.1 GntR family transcriptional regulator [Azospirillum lipoferum]MCP1611425.1 DNA-binding GntR family transcriptional regulator [Azospirillum lipoferum]MDW5537227.1 GntR family transcriptional regulator [Azospirillum sp. NL1]